MLASFVSMVEGQALDYERKYIFSNGGARLCGLAMINTARLVKCCLGIARNERFASLPAA
jgi:hypothetical protein